VSSRAAPAAGSRRCVRAQAVSAGDRAALFSAAAATALVLSAAPADAGVVLTQPTLKKPFQEDTTEKVPREQRKESSGGGFSLPSFSFGLPGSAPSPAAEKKDEAPISDGIDPRAIALPGSIIIVGGLAALAKNLDTEFDEFISPAMAKNSNNDGLGYEAEIKSTAGGIYGAPTGTKRVAGKKAPAKAPAKGTKATKAGKAGKGKAAAGGIGGFSFPNPFAKE